MSVQTELDRERKVQGYAVVPAAGEHLAALPPIEVAAAQLLRGHAPEAVLAETTPLETFSAAARAGRLWVAVNSGAPVGFAIVEMLAADLPHLDELDVHPAHGRRGVGTALVRAACRWAESNGYGMLTLTTFRDVPWNMPFYRRVGFTEIDAPGRRSELARVVANEAARGLDPERRVIMRYGCERTIRRAQPDDLDKMFEIWRRSAQGTHAFVAPDDLRSFEPLVRRYLESADDEFWILDTADGVPMGFMGLGPSSIESLFLAPEFLRRGGGRLLVEHARRLRHDLTVGVNEQNAGAVQFYKSCGFVVERRSELDDDGRPYPLLHMRLDLSACVTAGQDPTN